MEIEIDDKFLVLLGLLGLTFVLILLLTPKPPSTEVCFNAPKGEDDSKCIDALLAADFQTQKFGLSEKSSLTDNEGMLFVYTEEKKREFVTKNMKFPIDIIWLNRYKQIVNISRNIPPCDRQTCPEYSAKNKSIYVVEVAGNFTDRYNVSVGSEVFFEAPRG